MRVILDPAEDAAHGEWLRRTAGAYEWWYFDAVSDDGVWALVCIWFLGNPFSPYYRLAAQGRRPDPRDHNALFFALYRGGALHAYHFTRFPPAQVCADAARPATLRFGGNDLSWEEEGAYRLRVRDENANRRTLAADLTFLTSPMEADGLWDDASGDDSHFWLPIAPSCRVSGPITLHELHNRGAETIAFSGHGYHDHNWGTLPFAAGLRDWYWARAALGPGRAAVVYHVNRRARPPVSRLLLFENGRLIVYDAQARVAQGGWRVSGFGTLYATRLVVESGDVRAVFRLRQRLDSAPFYIRTRCRAEVTQGGRTEPGAGLGEYFRPGMLSWPLVASAMKARIVER